ncbi:hypothetical protein Poly24_41060 [Rosistilla carotiformis]|uniref:Prenyltransferase n=1 Tax=Rosistilla carotiformis TaxID=2528017 RepID=A0A518JXW9_9BACT|nr:hypothetical protein [Rosistilla carotiformis]QDV70384.1 hypothetical protein Poly24_41060 [Rosistilla carotiformis]
MATALADGSQTTDSRLIRSLEVPNCLSLDAPLVAVTWQWLLASVYSNSPSTDGVSRAMDRSQLAAMAVLCVTVWLIYMADRLLDCRRLNFTRDVPWRHRFANRHSRILWPIWFGMLALDGGLTLRMLDRQLRIAGAGLMGIVLLYCVAVHGSRWLRGGVPKEFVVGTVFAAGVCLPIALTEFSLSLVLTACVMAALFSLNCLCVAKVQSGSDRQQQVGSAILMFPWLASRLPLFSGTLAILATALGCWGLIPAAIAGATTLGAAGLLGIGWTIDRERGWIDAASCSALADYVLLSPLLVLLLANWL